MLSQLSHGSGVCAQSALWLWQDPLPSLPLCPGGDHDNRTLLQELGDAFGLWARAQPHAPPEGCVSDTKLWL